MARLTETFAARRAPRLLAGLLAVSAPGASRGAAPTPPVPAADPAAALEPGAPPLALQRYLLGRRLYAEGRFADAAREFESALIIFPDSVKLSYNAARSAERADRPADAARAYEDFVRKAPNDPDRADVLALAEGLWARAGFGRLRLESVPPGAALAFDAVAPRPVADRPEESRLPQGRHTVTLTLAGHVSETRTITIAAGETTSVSVQLSPVPSAAPSAPATAPASAAPAPPAVAATPPPSGRDARFYGGLACISLGAIGVGLGIWAHLDAADTAERAGALSPAVENDARYDRLISESEDASTLGWIGLGAGVALGAAGGVLLALSGSDGPTSAVAVAPGGITVRW